MTDTLQRITNEFIEAEDRIRLAGEADEKKGQAPRCKLNSFYWIG